jgi:hypothetical protein
MKKNDIIHVPADRIVIAHKEAKTVVSVAKMKDGDIKLIQPSGHRQLRDTLPAMLMNRPTSVFRIQIDDVSKRTGRILAFKDKDGIVEIDSELYNENCLEAMRCPQCGSLGPFKITVTTVLLVDDEGIDNEGIDNMWDKQSRCECRDCYNVGTAADFHEEPHDADDWTVSE